MKKFLLGVAVVLSAMATVSAQKEPESFRKLRMAAYAIDRFYVDTVNDTKLAEDAIIGMLKELDPHSTYMNPQEVKEMNEPLQGNFDGIGVQFNMLNDTLFVINTIPGGPSEKVGVMAGDRIIAVNDTAIAGVKMSNTDIMKRLRGPKGTPVEISVLRRGVKQPIQFRIIRDKIPIYSIDASYMADSKTGYIRVSRFGATTYEEFVEALEKLKKEGMQNLILDLEGNGGGYLNAAIDMANEFLNAGELIVYTQGRTQPREEAISNAKGNMKSGKLIVLVDESSASASEIVSGAIQDLDRGVIVGRRTFGKGLVQRPIPLPDGSMMRLTVARYYTPSGRSIQKPYSDGLDSYNRDLINRYNSGELTNSDSIHFPDSLRYKTSNGRTVFGGGGIMPDYFIPLDTTRYTDAHRDIVAKGVLNQFVMNYFDQHQKELKAQYKNFEAYDKGFSVTPEIMEELKQAAIKEGVKINEEQFAKSAPLMALQIKALIARDLFTVSDYFRVMNQESDSYKKALQLINNDDQYNKLLHTSR